MPGASASAVATSRPFVTTTSSRFDAQLEREVVRGRARVERDRLALADHRGRRTRDRALSVDLEAQPQIEADLRLALLERPHAAADARDEALAARAGEVAAHRHLRNRKRFRKFRNLNGIARLEQPEHVLHALADCERLRRSLVSLDGARPYARRTRKSMTLRIDFRNEHESKVDS